MERANGISERLPKAHKKLKGNATIIAAAAINILSEKPPQRSVLTGSKPTKLPLRSTMHVKGSTKNNGILIFNRLLVGKVKDETITANKATKDKFTRHI